MKNKIAQKIKGHKQFTEADYQYLSGKGYTDAEIIKIWDRDVQDGKEPIVEYVKAPDVVGYLNEGVNNQEEVC